MSQTQAVAGVNSLNSKIAGAPQILCNTTKVGARKARKTTEEECGRHCRSSVRAMSAISVSLESESVTQMFSDAVLIASGLFPVVSASPKEILSPNSFLSHLIIHHEILDQQSFRMFWIIPLLEPLLVPATCDVRRCCCFPKFLIF